MGEQQWKVLDSFEYLWIEVNERGQFRYNDKIYSPEYDKVLRIWLARIEDDDIGDLDPEYFVMQQFNKEWKPDDRGRA